MILINLLPPELRKRSTAYNPLVLAGVAGGAACLLLLLLCAFVQFGAIPAAERLRDDKTTELAEKTALADVVRAKETLIADHQNALAILRGLLAKKVYWAHALDDFANLLATNFAGYTVRCLDLNIAPGTAKKGPDGGETYAFRGRYQLVGDDRLKTGVYVKSLFASISASAFWKQHGFTGKPEDSYFGDTPTPNPEINKVVIPFNLEFERVRSKPKAGG